eukprot:scaffold31608_cov63-Phaeocystis_antarctica.AAC.7
MQPRDRLLAKSAARDRSDDVGDAEQLHVWLEVRECGAARLLPRATPLGGIRAASDPPPSPERAAPRRRQRRSTGVPRALCSGKTPQLTTHRGRAPRRRGKQSAERARHGARAHRRPSSPSSQTTQCARLSPRRPRASRADSRPGHAAAHRPRTLAARTPRALVPLAS